MQKIGENTIRREVNQGQLLPYRKKSENNQQHLACSKDNCENGGNVVFDVL